MQAKISMAIQLILAAAIFYLGYSIFAFTNKVGEVVDTYPQMIDDLSVVTEDLKVDEWLAFAEHIDELAPEVLVTVEAVRQTVEQVNQTVASVDSKIPSILSEVKNVRTDTVPTVLQEIKVLRTDVIPPTLNEVTRYRVEVVPPVLAESQAYREQVIPVVVQESAQLRADVPGILDQATELVDKSKVLAQTATQGAVEGTVKGVVLSPINLIRDAGNGIKTRVQGEEEVPVADR